MFSGSREGLDECELIIVKTIRLQGPQWSCASVVEGASGGGGISLGTEGQEGHSSLCSLASACLVTDIHWQRDTQTRSLAMGAVKHQWPYHTSFLVTSGLRSWAEGEEKSLDSPTATSGSTRPGWWCPAQSGLFPLYSSEASLSGFWGGVYQPLLLPHRTKPKVKETCLGRAAGEREEHSWGCQEQAWNATSLGTGPKTENEGRERWLESTVFSSHPFLKC